MRTICVGLFGLFLVFATSQSVFGWRNVTCLVRDSRTVCYTIDSTQRPLTNDEAATACGQRHRKGGRLAVILNSDVQREFSTKLTRTGYWIGARLRRLHRWTWMDGSTEVSILDAHTSPSRSPPNALTSSLATRQSAVTLEHGHNYTSASPPTTMTPTDHDGNNGIRGTEKVYEDTQKLRLYVIILVVVLSSVIIVVAIIVCVVYRRRTASSSNGTPQAYDKPHGKNNGDDENQTTDLTYATIAPQPTDDNTAGDDKLLEAHASKQDNKKSKQDKPKKSKTPPAAESVPAAAAASDGAVYASIMTASATSQQRDETNEYEIPFPNVVYASLDCQ